MARKKKTVEPYRPSENPRNGHQKAVAKAHGFQPGPMAVLPEDKLVKLVPIKDAPESARRPRGGRKSRRVRRHVWVPDV